MEMMVSIFIFLLMMTAIVQIFAQQIRAYRHARTVQGDMENAQFAMNYISKTLRTATVVGTITGSGTGATSVGQEDFLLIDGDDDFYTSSITDTETSLILYDFSQDKCLKLTFRGENYITPTAAGVNGDPYEGAALYMQTSKEADEDADISYDQIENCLDADVYSQRERRLTTGHVKGSFAWAPTRYEDNNITGERVTDAIGRVTVAMKVLPIEDKDKSDDKVTPVYMQTTTSLRDYPSDLSF